MGKPGCRSCCNLPASFVFSSVVESAQGDIVTDKDGNRFIDFLTSASSLNLGSCHPEIMSAVQEQFQKCTQYTPAYTYNEATITYAENLVSVYPGGVKTKIAFGNCGSDANDCAVKFARAYTGRKKIITFLNSYHGNTYGSCSKTVQKYRECGKDLSHFFQKFIIFLFLASISLMNR